MESERDKGIAVTLFVHEDDPQKDRYIAWEPLVDGIEFHDGRNVAEARNAILDCYPAGTHVVMIDDDLRGLRELPGGSKKLHASHAGKFRRLVTHAEGMMSLHRTRLWGMYPTDSTMFMSQQVKYGVYFVCGGIFGTIVTDDLRFDGELWRKEDYDYTLAMCARYGGVVRYDMITILGGRMQRGGVAAQRVTNPEQNDEAVARLVAKWPEWIRMNPKRQGEIILKKRQTR